MSHYTQARLQTLADSVARKKYDPARHKCFISYHAQDSAEVEQFIEHFGTEFIAKTVGVTDEDDFIDSEDTAYIMDQIRVKYLGDSSVTIVLVGECTWARRYVDWEIYSSLRDSKYSKVNGLLCIALPSVSGSGGPSLPARAHDNVTRDGRGDDVGYTRWFAYPTYRTTLRTWIDDAFAARTSRRDLIDNTRARRVRSTTCP